MGNKNSQKPREKSGSNSYQKYNTKEKRSDDKTKKNFKKMDINDETVKREKVINPPRNSGGKKPGNIHEYDDEDETKKMNKQAINKLSNESNQINDNSGTKKVNDNSSDSTEKKDDIDEDETLKKKKANNKNSNPAGDYNDETKKKNEGYDKQIEKKMKENIVNQKASSSSGKNEDDDNKDETEKKSRQSKPKEDDSKGFLKVSKYNIGNDIISKSQKSELRYASTSASDEINLLVVKIFSKDSIRKDRNAFEEIISKVKELDSENLIKLYDLEDDDKNWYLFMEYCNGGSLRKKMDDLLSIQDTMDIMFQLAAAVKNLHEKKIIHRNLRPEKILFDSNEKTIKITDFVFAKILDDIDNNKLHVSSKRTDIYASPEILNTEKKYSSKCDVWSLGCIFYEMIYKGIHPYFGKIKDISETSMFSEDYLQNSKKPIFFLDDRFPESLKVLIREMLQIEDKNRISINDVYNELDKIINSTENIILSFLKDGKSKWEDFNPEKKSFFKRRILDEVPFVTSQYFDDETTTTTETNLQKSLMTSILINQKSLYESKKEYDKQVQSVEFFKRFIKAKIKINYFYFEIQEELRQNQKGFLPEILFDIISTCLLIKASTPFLKFYEKFEKNTLWKEKEDSSLWSSFSSTNEYKKLHKKLADLQKEIDIYKKYDLVYLSNLKNEKYND